MTATLDSSFRPSMCVWEITRGCNLRCTHCGSSAGRAAAAGADHRECLDVRGPARRAAVPPHHALRAASRPSPGLGRDRPGRGVARGIAVNLVSNGT